MQKRTIGKHGSRFCDVLNDRHWQGRHLSTETVVVDESVTSKWCASGKILELFELSREGGKTATTTL